MKNKFVIYFIILIVVVLASVVLYGYAKTEDAGTKNQSNDNSVQVKVGPKIEVSPTSYDFGTVVYGQVARQNFAVKNVGNEPLEILRLSTSCGCTKAMIADQDKIVAPGQSVNMEVSFDPAVHADDSDLGDIIRVVYINTNDSENPEVEVEITANVIKEE